MNIANVLFRCMLEGEDVARIVFVRLPRRAVEVRYDIFVRDWKLTLVDKLELNI